MVTPRKNSTEVLFNCATKACHDQGCSDCDSIKNNGTPFGITIIPGSGKLSEFPPCNDNLNGPEDGTSCLEQLQNKDICPKACIPQSICVREPQEFAAISHINFINGDLIIADPLLPAPFSGSSILQILPVVQNNDLTDIFPNLLGINGSLYVVGTNYRMITGFDKLRFVTGSIVFVNNFNLITIPTFPSLLNVGGQIIGVPPISLVEDAMITAAFDETAALDQNEIIDPRCGRGAIIIANNALLRKITGFEALRQVKDGIFIADNPCLQHICGFIHLYRTDRIVIKGNAKLSKIIGFCYIDTINTGLYILDNDLETDVDLLVSAFVMLETAGRIVITGNKTLKSIKFDALRIVVNEFIIRSNDSLDEISSSVQFVSDLYIENNRNLHTIKMACLYEVNHIMSVSSNCSIVCIDTFDELRRVGDGIIIADNKQLVELKGFNKLKYIGSDCVTPPFDQQPSICKGCKCIAGTNFDWSTITNIDCTITDNFPVNAFDDSSLSCAYILPIDFFRLTCNANIACSGLLLVDEDIPQILSFSLIIYGNPRLKAIGGFCGLKHVNSVIYIINNSVLHTINAFGQLAFALDIWIRNNPSLKFIIGFSNLLAVRDFVIYETACLCDFNGLKLLEFAQDIAIEAKNVKSVKLRKTPIPTVLGYILYFSYNTKC